MYPRLRLMHFSLDLPSSECLALAKRCRGKSPPRRFIILSGPFIVALKRWRRLSLLKQQEFSMILTLICHARVSTSLALEHLASQEAWRAASALLAA